MESPLPRLSACFAPVTARVRSAFPGWGGGVSAPGGAEAACWLFPSAQRPTQGGTHKGLPEDVSVTPAISMQWNILEK